MVSDAIASHRVSILDFSILIKKLNAYFNPNDILLPSTHLVESLVSLHCVMSMISHK